MSKGSSVPTSPPSRAPPSNGRKLYLCWYKYWCAALVGISIQFSNLYPWFSIAHDNREDTWAWGPVNETNRDISSHSTKQQSTTIRPIPRPNITTSIPFTRNISTSQVHHHYYHHDLPPNSSIFQRFLNFPTRQELQSSCPPRLEFLHIPKSGGTAIETAAFQQANIAWGACHFHLNYHNQPWPNLCPRHLRTVAPLHQWPNHSSLQTLWHYPLHWLLENATLTGVPLLPSNPYHNVPAETTATITNNSNITTTTNSNNITTTIPSTITCPPQDQPLHFFVVVRNPYTRAISEFYFQVGPLFKRNPQKMQRPMVMNRWIHKRLDEYRKRQADPRLGWNSRSLHWIPQAEFIWDHQGQRRIHYVLKFENLTAELDELASRYHIPVTLAGVPHYKSGSIPASERLGPEHLNKVVRSELEQHFAKDFALGDYPLYHP